MLTSRELFDYASWSFEELVEEIINLEAEVAEIRGEIEAMQEIIGDLRKEVEGD